MTSKAVANKSGTSVVSHDYGNLSGQGFEETTGSDLSIPFINLLQSNSPVVSEQIIPGARSGDMMNTVTRELIKFEDGFTFIPVHTHELWVEWVPQTMGGGFVTAHDPQGEFVQNLIKNNGNSRIPPKGDDNKRIPFKNGKNEIVETYYVYGLILNKEGTDVEGFAVIAFSSTKVKPYRDWLTSMWMLRGKPPIFANRAHITSIKQKNDSGTYANFRIDPLRETWAKSLIDPKSEEHLLNEAIAFRDMVQNGAARADFSHQESSSDSDTVSSGAAEEGKAPF